MFSYFVLILGTRKPAYLVLKFICGHIWCSAGHKSRISTIQSKFSIQSTGHRIEFADDIAIIYDEDKWYILKLQVKKDLKLGLYKLLTMNFKKTHCIPFFFISNEIIVT